MKSLQFIIIILFSFVSFSQNYKDKLDEMIGYYNDDNNKYSAIANDLLNNKYGKIDNETRFYCEYFLGYELILKDEFIKALDKYKSLLKFCELNTIDDTYGNLRKCIKNIKSSIKSLDTLVANLPVENNSTPEINNTVTENSQNNVISETIKDDDKNKDISNNNNKTVTLTVSGTGKTIEEAKTNALRSAIEQAFGAYITSKTETLNDSIIKDNIVSISSGFVQSYDVISEYKASNEINTVTLIAVISIENLTSFAKNKGITVEFEGNMFVSKIMLQKINEESEFTAIKNLLTQTFYGLENSIQHELKVEEPMFVNDDTYRFKLEVIQKPNINYTKVWDYFKNSLKKISANNTEVLELKKNGKNIYQFNIDENIFFLRNEKSINAIYNFYVLSNLFSNNSYIVKNNFEIIKIKSLIGKYFDANTFNFDQYGRIYPQYEISNTSPQQLDIKDKYAERKSLLEYVKLNGFKLDYFLESNLIIRERHDYISREFKNIEIKSKFQENYIYYNLDYKLSDIKNLKKFEITRLPLDELLINYENYRTDIEKKEPYYCFLKGTKILTPDGEKNIEKIMVGDEVICFDDKGKLHVSEVESINSHQNAEVFEYSVWNGDSLFATPNHWVLTSENTFIEIGKINEMLTLVDVKGGLRPMTKINYFGKATVYNFIVKDYHTYIANGIRVHNGGKGKYKNKSLENNK